MPRQLARKSVLFLAAILLLPLASLPREPDKKSKEKNETTNLRIQVTGGEPEKPVGGANVHVESETEDQTFDVRTNDAGVAKVSKVPRGRVLIQVTADGWKTFGQRYELNKEEQTIKITLESS